MEKTLKKYGIMGGTFDPIHIGHLVLAEEVRAQLELDKVIFMPTGNPPHKDQTGITDAKHRLHMTLLATISNPYFEVSSLEIERQGMTYTIDTIKTLRQMCKDEVQFYFITGADAISQLHTWKEIDELLGLCKFVSATRPGFETTKVEREIEGLQNRYNRTIYPITVSALDVSSTDIRERIRSGRTVKYLLPELVNAYIERQDLYKNQVSRCWQL